MCSSRRQEARAPYTELAGQEPVRLGARGTSLSKTGGWDGIFFTLGANAHWPLMTSLMAGVSHLWPAKGCICALHLKAGIGQKDNEERPPANELELEFRYVGGFSNDSSCSLLHSLAGIGAAQQTRLGSPSLRSFVTSISVSGAFCPSGAFDFWGSGAPWAPWARLTNSLVLNRPSPFATWPSPL